MAQEISYNELLDSVLERMVEIDPNFSVDALRTSVESDDNLRPILVGEEIGRRRWIEALTKNLTSRDCCKGDYKLGTSYSLRDLFSKKKIGKKELLVRSEQATTKFSVINGDGKKRTRSKCYAYVHLVGIEFTCYSFLRRGCDAVALAAVYDPRDLQDKKGCLALVAFPLGLGTSSAVIRTNYCVSTQDASVWTVLVSDHGLVDGCHPYTIRMKSVCKYASNYDNFTFSYDSEMEPTFHLPIEAGKDVQVMEAVKNLLCKPSTLLLINDIFNFLDSEKEDLLKINEGIVSKLSRSLSLQTRSNMQTQSEVERRKSLHCDELIEEELRRKKRADGSGLVDIELRRDGRGTSRVKGGK